MRNLLVLIICSLCISVPSLAQKRVSGVIVDSQNQTIPGVAVIVQTTDSVYVNAGVSDMDGRFSIESDTRPFRLFIQHIAYQSMSLESDQDNVGTLILHEAVNELGDGQSHPSHREGGRGKTFL